jgi:glucose-6-phosphate isomerase
VHDGDDKSFITEGATFRLGDVRFDPTADLVTRLWDRDSSLWAAGEDDPATRLGWLDLPETMVDELTGLEAFAEAVRREGISEIVLLGMGGSSLAPEMFAHTFGSAQGYPTLRVVDTTHPLEIEAVTRAIDLERALFLVSSKSGGTLETVSLYHYFRDLVSRGSSFVAITDSGTSLDELARAEDFRAVFRATPDVGGRYSAFTHFGVVPAVLLGVDVAALLKSARAMREACGPDTAPEQNPGLALGQAIGTLALRERHALTFLASDSIASLASWIEQLIAESTGKGGRGVVPVVDEPRVDPSEYGNDRAFVHLRLSGDDSLDELVEELVARGHPAITVALEERAQIGAEIFRWEFATAVAGAVLGVNPFDQPDVEEAKRASREALESHDPLSWPDDDPEAPFEGSRPGEIAALLAFAARSPESHATIAAGRRRLVVEHGVATSAGFGPRYLHSTGQLHKGGPPGLRALVVLQEAPEGRSGGPAPDLDFARIVAAQAAGDVVALRNAGRVVAQTTWERFERWARGG